MREIDILERAKAESSVPTSTKSSEPASVSSKAKPSTSERTLNNSTYGLPSSIFQRLVSEISSSSRRESSSDSDATPIITSPSLSNSILPVQRKHKVNANRNVTLDRENGTIRFHNTSTSEDEEPAKKVNFGENARYIVGTSKRRELLVSMLKDQVKYKTKLNQKKKQTSSKSSGNKSEKSGYNADNSLSDRNASNEVEPEQESTKQPILNPEQILAGFARNMGPDEVVLNLDEVNLVETSASYSSNSGDEANNELNESNEAINSGIKKSKKKKTNAQHKKQVELFKELLIQTRKGSNTILVNEGNSSIPILSSTALEILEEKSNLKLDEVATQLREKYIKKYKEEEEKEKEKEREQEQEKSLSGNSNSFTGLSRTTISDKSTVPTSTQKQGLATMKMIKGIEPVNSTSSYSISKGELVKTKKIPNLKQVKAGCNRANTKLNISRIYHIIKIFDDNFMKKNANSEEVKTQTHFKSLKNMV